MRSKAAPHGHAEGAHLLGVHHPGHLVHAPVAIAAWSVPDGTSTPHFSNQLVIVSISGPCTAAIAPRPLGLYTTSTRRRNWDMSSR